MGKKKFNFRQDKSIDVPEKGIDELFEEQFKNKKPDEASVPDIPISLADINKAVNSEASTDSGEEIETLEHIVVDDGEGAEDLEELNEETAEESEEELDAEDLKKKKRKADREKGRKNEKAYQKKTREMEEANRKNQEEMRKQSERLHNQDEENARLNVSNSVNNEPSGQVNISDMAESTKRNQSLMEDDFEAERIRQTQEQKNKTDKMIADQREKERATQDYKGYGNKNIDFSGNNNHGSPSSSGEMSETSFSDSRDSRSDTEKLYSSYPENRELDKSSSSQIKNESENQGSYFNKDNYMGNKDRIAPSVEAPINNNPEVFTSPINIKEPEIQGSSSHESISRRQEQQFMDDDYAAKEQAEARNRRDKLNSMREEQRASEEAAKHYKSQDHGIDFSGKGNNWKPTGDNQSSPITSDNPSGNRVDYKQEEKENRKIHNESDGNHIFDSDKSQSYHEEQTSSLNDRRSNYQEQREDRSQVRNGNPTSDSSKKNNNYRDNYSSKRESASVESRPGNSSDIQKRSDTVQSQNSYGLENSTPSRLSDTPTDRRSDKKIVTEPNRVSDYRSLNTSHKIGSGKDLDGANRSVQINLENKSRSFGATVLGSGRDLETNTSKNTLLSSNLKEDKINRINMIRNSRDNSSTVIINKSGKENVILSNNNKIEIVFSPERNNKPESAIGRDSISAKNNPSGYKIKISNMNNYRHVDKIEKDGKALYKNREQIHKPVVGIAGAVGMISDAGAERIKRIKENIKEKNNTATPGKSIMHINPSKSPESNGRIPEGKTLSTTLYLKKREDNNEKTEKLNQKQGSFFTAKKEYAKLMGFVFVRIGESLAQTTKDQVWRALKENDAIDAADKTKMIIGGTMAVGAFLRVKGHQVGAASNFLKAKGNSIANAGRFFKGSEKKELKIVPHTARQFKTELKKYGNLNDMKPRNINMQISKLQKDIKLTEKLLNGAKLDEKTLSKLFGSKKINPKDMAALEKFLEKQKDTLKKMTSFKDLKNRSLMFNKAKMKARKFGRAMNLIMAGAMRSGDLSGQTISTGLDTIRYIKHGLKLTKGTGVVSLKAGTLAFKTGKKVTKTVNKIPIVNKATTKVVNSKPIKGMKDSIGTINSAALKLKGGALRQLNGGLYNKASMAFSKKAPEKLKKAVSSIGKGANTIGKATKKVKNGAKKVTSVVTKPFKIIAKPFQLIGKAVDWVKKKVLQIVGIFALFYVCILCIMQIVVLPMTMIFTDTDNLQKYVNSLLEKQNDFDWKISNYQNQGGKKHGKYKEVTINFVDQNGNQIDSTNNMKEILSMVAVKIDNDWPDWYEVFDRNKVDKIAKQLFDDSHKIETTEIGPYSCPGCEERDYKCTDSLPADASADRIRLHNLYADRGGCKPYNENITYYCSNDTAKMPNGSIVSNAHTQSWANNYMKTLYDNYYSQGGDTIKHSDSYDSPASGCSNYRTEQYVKGTMANQSNWPSTVTFTWNSTNNRYEFSYGGTTWYLSAAKDGNSITYKYANGRYETYGTKYICKEYKCNGHNTSITKYKCEGHHETYCPGDHYDLIVNAIVLHFPALYEADSTSLGVCEYPEDAGEDDFYWSQGNIDWCQSIYSQDWESTYEGLVGLDNASVTGEPLSTEEIEAYLEKLPEDLSEDRKKVIETALGAVGKIPYYWGGTASCKGYNGNNFGATVPADIKGRTKKGLDCSHFIDWVCWTAVNNNLGNGWTGTIWDQTTGISKYQLKPGDLGFQNEGGNSTNHVGFYLGDGYWIHCSGSGNNVVVNKTTVFTHYRRLNILD